MTARRACVTIQSNAAGQRLDAWLAGRFTYHPLDEWHRLIADGRILCSGEPATADHILVVGDEIEYIPEPREEPEVDKGYSIVYEDDAILVVNKPPNLPCHPSGKFFENTLWYLLRETYPECRFVHRLDRETSGIVLLAKDKRNARILGRQFARRDVKKEYLVVVEGEFPEHLIADGVLVAASNSEVRKKRGFVEVEEDGETATTEFRLVEARNGISLVHAIPTTGRLHQIRATLWSLGYPVVGDKIYGVDDRFYIRFITCELTNDDRETLRLKHQALHAWRLTVQLPDRDLQVFEAPPPTDVMELLAVNDISGLRLGGG